MTIESIIRELATLPGDYKKLPASDAMFDPCVRFDVERVDWIVRNVRDGDRVLEIGVGYAYVAVAIARMRAACTVVATELPGRACLSDDAFQGLLRAERIELKPWTIGEPMDPLLGTYQTIVLSEVVEHLNPATVMQCLGEVAKALAPGGVVILTTPNVLRLRNRLRFALGSTIFDSPSEMVDGAHGHIREYSHAEISAMLRVVGLSPEVHASGVSFPVAPSMINGVIRMVGSFLSRLSITFDDEVFLLARK